MVVQSQFIEETQRWENEGTIRDLIHNTVEKAGKKYSADSKIRYIDISSVDNGTNTVTGVTEYIFKDAPSRAQQCVREGDILVSTVRPNLKNIAVNHLDGDDLVASSGFCVLRPKEGCAGLIMAYILSDVFTEKMTLVAKGTNYPAIHDSDILNYKIRLSDDSKVSMIDRLFKQADKSKFDGIKSQFIEMIENTPYVKSLCDVINSIQTGKLDANAEVKNGRYPFFTCDSLPKRIDTYAFDTEAILVSGNGSQIGHINFYSGKFNAYQRTYVLSDFNTNVKSKYLVFYFRLFLKPYIMDNAKGSAIPYITLPILQSFRIHIPNLETQNKVCQIIEQADKSKYLS